MGARPCRGVPASGSPAPSRVGRGVPAPPPLSPLPTVAPRHGGRGSATLRDSGSRGNAPRVRYASALRDPPPIIFRLTRSPSPPLARSARWQAVGRKRPPFPPPPLARSFRAWGALPLCSFDFLSRFQYKNAMIIKSSLDGGDRPIVLYWTLACSNQPRKKNDHSKTMVFGCAKQAKKPHPPAPRI